MKHTYCFKYKNIDFDICYIWIEAVSEGAAKLQFEENPECTDCLKILSITETFNWQ